uniref:NADH dehydrogenase subunit 2 n=1 Tax=Lasmigona complanata TaxID=85050 RepID=UPI00226C6643|nr:NADH dehydrogenase subunit 2 [Lasmigona complanata]UZC55583.1 NADH dehydrogenase subunit 2 [Lasmigona complanata]
MKSPNKFLFVFLLISSTFVVATSSCWLTTWVGLEMNMLGYIPFIFVKESSSESEAAVKYLIPQSLGSTIYLLAVIPLMFTNKVQSLVMIAMCLKLGVAPFHFWFPTVMVNLQLLPAFILLTWQKITPILTINSFSTLPLEYVMPIAMISALWGGIGGMNQTDIRLLLTYSSIGHNGWMLASLYSTYTTMTIYMTTYMLINISIYFLLLKKNTKSCKQLFFYGEPSKTFMLAISILSLGGLPPFAGFLMKLLVLLHTKAEMIIIFSLIIGALMSLFYYLSLTFATLLSISEMYFIKPRMITKKLMLFFLVQTLPLILTLFFF